jgi:hemin uptake protein HemP
VCQQDKIPTSANNPERSRDTESPFLRIVDSADLFDGKNELMIRHNDSFYRQQQADPDQVALFCGRS